MGRRRLSDTAAAPLDLTKVVHATTDSGVFEVIIPRPPNAHDPMRRLPVRGA